jgi:hypothetical protein
MATFARLDKRMMRDINQLHDFLWHSKGRIDGGKLFAGLEKDAREIDAILHAGGRLRRNAVTLLQAARGNKDRHGAALFEFLHGAYHLTAATEHVRKKDHKGAGEHAAWVVESDSIGTCSAAGAFEIVQEWEAGKIDFEAYTSKIADMLQQRGVPGGGQYRRMLLAARTLGKDWDRTLPKGGQAVAGCAAVVAAAWCTVATGAVRAALGRPRAVPEAEYAEIVARIVARL